MKVDYIILHNIGPYKGEKKFDLYTTKKRNVILIGGKNGAGKTTLLKAIKIGLFGCFAYGFKNESATYVKEIKNLLNHQTSENVYFIRMGFEIVEEYEKTSYIVQRSWTLSGEELNEAFRVHKNGNLLASGESYDFINKLKSLTSPALINSFIYDGEKVSSIIEQGLLSAYIKEVFYSIFNVDLLEQLGADLTGYLTKTTSSLSSKARYDIRRLLNDIEAKKMAIRSKEARINELSKEIANIQAEIKSNKSDFAKLDGLTKEEITDFQTSLSSYEKETEENNRILKSFYEDYLPLVMVTENIKEIVARAKKELPLQYAEMLKVVQNYLKEDFTKYIEILVQDGREILFDLDGTKIEKLERLIDTLTAEREKVKNIFSRREELVDLTQALKKRIENNFATDRIDEILKNLDSLKAELSLKQEELALLEGEYNEDVRQRDKLYADYQKANAMLKKDKQADSSYVNATTVLAVCAQFKAYIIEKKLDAIAELTCEIFNDTICKVDYIAGLKFDDKFQLTAVDSQGRSVELNTFSAGEMQILVSSLIWAMFKISGRRELFVFDTPLARLDAENRIQFINKIIATIGDQVVILSTDSEFVGKNYEAITDRISRSYLLSYDDDTKTTAIENTYFGGEV